MQVRLLVSAPHLNAHRGDVVDVSPHEAEVWLMIKNAVPVDEDVEPSEEEAENVDLADLIVEEEENADGEPVNLDDLEVSGDDPAAEDDEAEEDFFAVS